MVKGNFVVFLPLFLSLYIDQVSPIIFFSKHFPLYYFLLYEVLSTAIFHRHSLYSFLYDVASQEQLSAIEPVIDCCGRLIAVIVDFICIFLRHITIYLPDGCDVIGFNHGLARCMECMVLGPSHMVLAFRLRCRLLWWCRPEGHVLYTPQQAMIKTYIHSSRSMALAV